ncbi:MAG: ABC transporter permease [Dehalococcoidia bacterium]|nr:ABC transporter permease [Dehalococcoidia bacterium]
MNVFVLFKKEAKEQVKTYRLLIVAAVFLLFGLSTPLLFKFLPEILEMSGEGIPIEIPAFTPSDALKSYVNSLGQIGVLVAVLVAMGAIAQERERGTIIMTLSKPVGFGEFAVAKLAALVVTFLIGVALGALACFYYTTVLLGSVDVQAFLAINLLIALYFVVCLSITLMYSAFFKSQLAAGALALVTLLVMGIVSSIPPLAPYMPSALMGWGQSLAVEGGGSAWPALIISGAIIVAAVLAAWQVLSRKEL